MREMRDRAGNLYVTVGPSTLNIPVNVYRERYVRVDRDLVARYAAAPKVETPSMVKYRQAFHPTPAPTTRLGKALHKLCLAVSSVI